MSIKKTGFLIAAIILAALPFYAQAGNLIVNNHTDFDSTTMINNGACSTILGEMGISRAHTDGNVVPDAKVKLACFLNKRNCKADVYLTANCTGPKIATVMFDVDSGIKFPVTIYDTRYDIIGSGFTTTIVQK